MDHDGCRASVTSSYLFLVLAETKISPSLYTQGTSYAAADAAYPQTQRWTRAALNPRSAGWHLAR